MPPRLRLLLQLLAGGLLPGLWIALTVLPKSATLIYSWPWTLYAQLLLLVPVALLAALLLRRPASLPARCAWLAAPALALAVSVVLCRRPAFSFEAALPLWSMLAWCGCVALSISGSCPPADDRLPRLLRQTRFAGLIASLPLIASLLLWSAELSHQAAAFGGWSGVLPRIASFRNMHPFGHWNYTGGYALLALPFLAALARVEHGRWRAAWTCASLLSLVVLLSSASRGAVLGLATALAAGFGLALLGRTIPLRKAAPLAILGLAAVGTLILANPRLRALAAHPSTLLSPNEGDVQRIGMLQAGGLLFRKAPVLGHGPGMTPFVYPEVRAQIVGGVETSYQLHNGPLQLLVDSGILGLLCWLALASVLLLAGVRWAREKAEEGAQALHRTLALCSMSGLCGYAVMFFTDYQFNLMAIVTLAGLHAGILLAFPRPRPAAPAPLSLKAPGRIVAAVLLASVVLGLAVLTPSWRARSAFASAWWEADGQDDPHIADGLRQAVRIAPHNPHYLTHLGLRLALDAGRAPSPEAAVALRTEAVAVLSQSLSLDSAQEPVHAALAWLWLGADPAKARGHFRRAVELIPDRDTLHLGLALCALNLNDRPGTVHELALECLVNPSFAASPLWMTEPFANLHSDVMARTTAWYAAILQDPRTPGWRKPPIAYATAFHRWWLGGPPPSGGELAGALPHQQQFFAALRPSGLDPQIWHPGNANDRLLLASRTFARPSEGAALLKTAYPALDENAIAGALARLKGSPADFSAFLRSRAPGGTGIVSQRIDRGHYAIMNRNLDGPGYYDLAPRIMDSFTATFASPLRPPRGLIPDDVLTSLK